MARRSIIQHPNSGIEGGHLLQSAKLASSESSASEKAEDTGERQNGFSHYVRSLEGQPGTLAGYIRAVDDAVLDYDSHHENSCTSSFEFQKGDKGSIKPSLAPYISKAAPSKWDDAEKWLVSPTSGDAPAKAKTKSGPLYGHHGYGGSHPGKRSNVSNQHEWHGHSHAMKNGYQTQYTSDLAHGSNTVQSVDVDRHPENSKLVVSSHSDQHLDLADEWTRNMDILKGSSIGPGGAPNFAFMPAHSSLPNGGSLHSYPLADEPVDMKEVSVSHEGNHDESPLKPISRICKPTSDSLVSAPFASPAPAVHSISMRDMGTEMTPIASQEPSRTGTPLRATTPTFQSPVSSCLSTPRESSPMSSPVDISRNLSPLSNAGRTIELSEKTMATTARREVQIPGIHVGGKLNIVSWASKEEEDADASKLLKNIDLEEVKKNVLETRAAAWEEAEQSKYLARFKREEANILAWESHEKAKAEAELRQIEVKIEKIRMRAHEKLLVKLTAARQKAEKRRTDAEEKRCEQAAKTTLRADYIRQTGRLPSSYFSCNFCL